MIMDGENENKKLIITQHFITALDYLVDSGRLKTIAEFERATGFRQQRITGMRKFLSGDDKSKSYLAHTDHLAVLFEMYGVSLKYLISGEEPILESEKIKEKDSEPISDNNTKCIQEIREEINLLKSKYEFLKDRIEFLNEKQKSLK
jgi:hypothetical protein